MAPIFHRLLALSALLSVVFSLPHSNWVGSGKIKSSKRQLNHSHLSQLQQQMPTQPGLPSSGNLNLVFAAVGVGYQNYSCDGTAYVSNLSGDGAAAYLYDASEYFQAEGSNAIENLPSQRLAQFLRDGQSQLKTNINPTLPFLGKHFFDAQVRPNFDLFAAVPSRYLLAAKEADVKAPNATDIDWLYLEDANGVMPGVGETKGLKAVYRVATAGGKAPASCSTAGQQQQVPYAAEYWFYD